MESILITPKSEEEVKAINDVLAKMNISSKIISEEAKEDLGLLAMMKEVDRDDRVTEEEILNKLRS